MSDEVIEKNDHLYLSILNINQIQEKFDVKRFLGLINAQHQVKRKYECTADAIETLKMIEKKLHEIDAASNFGYFLPPSVI